MSRAGNLRWGLKVKGLAELGAKLDALGVRAVRELNRALYNEAQLILTAAQALTPVETGALKGSGIVPTPEEDATGVRVTIGFGGAAAPYAIYVHERLDTHHEPPTQAKFLETALNAAAPDLLERVAERVWYRVAQGTARMAGEEA